MKNIIFEMWEIENNSREIKTVRNKKQQCEIELERIKKEYNRYSNLLKDREVSKVSVVDRVVDRYLYNQKEIYEEKKHDLEILIKKYDKLIKDFEEGD